MMMPPPTPVPSVTITIFLWPFPPPFHISPRAATFASFPTFTGSPPRASDSSAATSLMPQPTLTHRFTMLSRRTAPGTPMPTPATSSFSISLSSSFFRMEAAISGRICAPFLSFTVGISHFSSRSPATLKRPIFTVVPPTSTPNAYVFMIFSFADPHAVLFIFRISPSSP